MAVATYLDANVLLQLAQLHALMDVGRATNWVWSDEFAADFAEFREKYPLGSEEALMVSRVCGFYETVGTLWKHGLINEGLLFDWLAVHPVWERVKSFALGLREASGEPRIYENFEAMAAASAKWG